MAIFGDIPHTIGMYQMYRRFHQVSAAFGPPPADSRYWTSRETPWSGDSAKECQVFAKDPETEKVVPIQWGLYLFNMFLCSKFRFFMRLVELMVIETLIHKRTNRRNSSTQWSASFKSFKQWLCHNCMEMVDPQWLNGGIPFECHDFRLDLVVDRLRNLGDSEKSQNNLLADSQITIHINFQ